MLPANTSTGLPLFALGEFNACSTTIAAQATVNVIALDTIVSTNTHAINEKIVIRIFSQQCYTFGAFVGLCRFYLKSGGQIMITPTLSSALPTRQPPRRMFLRLGFWLLILTLLTHQMLIVIPSYQYGIVAAYQAGAHLKEMHFAVPGYTPYSLLSNALLLLSALLFGVVWWVAPVASLLWAAGLWRSRGQVSARLIWRWAGTLGAFWLLTLLTHTASYAFLLWVMD